MSTDLAPVVAEASEAFPTPDDERSAALARRVAMLDAGARALYWRHLGRSGRTRLPKDFNDLKPETRELFLVDALRVLQAAGVL